MTDQEENVNLGKFVFEHNSQEQKVCACLGKTCSGSLIYFSSQVFVILLNIFNCFWKTHLLKTGDESYLFGWDIEWCSRIHFTFAKAIKKFFLQKCPVFTLAGLSLMRKMQLADSLWKIAFFQTKSDKLFFLLSTPATISRCYAKRN